MRQRPELHISRLIEDMHDLRRSRNGPSMPGSRSSEQIVGRVERNSRRNVESLSPQMTLDHGTALGAAAITKHRQTRRNFAKAGLRRNGFLRQDENKSFFNQFVPLHPFHIIERVGCNDDVNFAVH